MNKTHCIGCYNNFYNGNNGYGIQECWSLKDAKFIKRKRVSINQVPPWTQKAGDYPNCYRESGYVFVGPDQTN
jgi:hypothetical protein